jgi:ribulose-phosphate 3-epimerase
MKISPSILAADLTDLKNTLQTLENRVDFLHMDIMDGHFVPTLSFGEVYVKLLKDHTNIPLDVHLMVDQPEKKFRNIMIFLRLI